MRRALVNWDSTLGSTVVVVNALSLIYEQQYASRSNAALWLKDALSV
jgi:hypothetical protein